MRKHYKDYNFHFFFATREDWKNIYHGVRAQILKDLGMKRMTNPRKIPSMTGCKLEVDEYILPEASSKTTDYWRAIG